MGNKKRVIQLNLTDVPFTTRDERVALASRIELLLNQHIKELTGDLSCRDYYTAIGTVLEFKTTFEVKETP